MNQIATTPILPLILQYLEKEHVLECLHLNSDFYRAITHNWSRMERAIAQVKLQKHTNGIYVIVCLNSSRIYHQVCITNLEISMLYHGDLFELIRRQRGYSIPLVNNEPRIAVKSQVEGLHKVLTAIRSRLNITRLSLSPFYTQNELRAEAKFNNQELACINNIVSKATVHEFSTVDISIDEVKKYLPQALDCPTISLETENMDDIFSIDIKQTSVTLIIRDIVNLDVLKQLLNECLFGMRRIKCLRIETKYYQPTFLDKSIDIVDKLCNPIRHHMSRLNERPKSMCYFGYPKYFPCANRLLSSCTRKKHLYSHSISFRYGEVLGGDPWMVGGLRSIRLPKRRKNSSGIIHRLVMYLKLDTNICPASCNETNRQMYRELPLDDTCACAAPPDPLVAGVD